jgi:MFS family permease
VSVSVGVYLAISAVMFLEFAVWGAWLPVLAARLLGPLKMNGKQTSWVYATLPIACVISPFVAGPMADQWVNAEWILAACHLLGAVLLFVAVWQRSFVGVFVTMLLYSLCYAATLPLVNTVLFAHVDDPATQSWVFIWAPVAWALIGYALSGWRFLRGGEGDGSDCLKFAALLSVLMAIGCGLLHFVVPTPPSGAEGTPLKAAFAMLQQPDFLIFMLTSLVIAGLMQFYFLGSARYMTDVGISAKAVPATMGMAQVAQAGATIVVLGTLLGLFGNKSMLDVLGYKTTLALGAASWVVLYSVYILSRPIGAIVVSQAFHGVAYVMFMIVGQVFVANYADKAILGSAQSLLSAATMGLGPFLGVQLAGIAMDHFSADGKFQWRKIWAVPLAITLVTAIVLATAFKGDIKGGQAPQPETAVAERAT